MVALTLNCPEICGCKIKKKRFSDIYDVNKKHMNPVTSGFLLVNNQMYKVQASYKRKVLLLFVV
jgi:hypothetical protein